MEKFEREIFEQLGNLFYSIAKDQHVTPLQFGELKMILRKDWLTDPKHIGSDSVPEAVHLIIFAMDTLQGQSASPESAFESFTNFYAEHREQFSEALKDEIIRTAMEVTRVFPSGSGRINNHIQKLKLLFHNSSLLRLRENMLEQKLFL